MNSTHVYCIVSTKCVMKGYFHTSKKQVFIFTIYQSINIDIILRQNLNLLRVLLFLCSCKLPCKILKTKICVPFEVQCYSYTPVTKSTTHNVYFKLNIYSTCNMCSVWAKRLKHGKRSIYSYFVSPAKHGRHTGIMTPSASPPSSATSHFWFLINNF